MNKMCLLYYLIYLCFFFSCSTIKLNKNNNKLIDEINNEFSDIQPIIIYKTTLDYSKNVPVILSSDKSKIISYPSPKDVFYKENFAYPTKLTDGFLMDNIGISCNSAYLNLTLEEYSKYDEIPSLENLYKMIIDKDPISDYYICNELRNIINENNNVNQIIKNSGLKKCKCLKKQL